MKNRKIKITDTKKWGSKVLISSFIIFLILIFLIPFTKEIRGTFILPVVGFSIFLVLGYWIYAYITTNMYVTIEDFLKVTKNYAPEVVVNMLKKINFSDKEINDIMTRRGTVISLKPNDETLTPAVEKAIEEFNKLGNWEKVDFRNSLPVYRDSTEMTWEVEDLEEYTKFCEKHSLSDYSEYEYLVNYINDIVNDDVDKYYQLAKKELSKYYGTNNYSDAISTEVLSVSNKKLQVKIEKEHGRIKLLFHNNELLLLSSEFKKFYADEISKEDDDKWFLVNNYRKNEFDVEKHIIDRIKYDDIIFYVPEGNIDVNTIVSGGGMSGSNISGYDADFYQNNKMLFNPTGDAGAVYSMLKNIKIDPIKTDIVSSDNRVVVLKTNNMDLVFTREERGSLYSNKVEDLYSWLVDKMPDKDYERIVLKNGQNNNSAGSSNLDEIKKLKELLDMGAITQDEYDKKKKELLKSKTTD